MMQRVRYEGGTEDQDEWIQEGSERLREPQPEEVQYWSAPVPADSTTQSRFCNQARSH